MRTLGERLRDDDPLIDDPGLSETEVSAMRRRVVSEAVARPGKRALRRDGLAVAAAVVLIVVAGVTAARRAHAPAALPGEAAGGTVPPAERRQLQFATPGGTRIIWTLDSEFTLKETMP